VTTTALIVAAGKGERFGGGTPKQYRLLGGKPVLRWAVEPFFEHPQIDTVRVVIGRGQEALASEALSGLDVGEFVLGAEERAYSAINGLRTIRGRTDYILVHDAARPFCPQAVIDRLLDALQDRDAAVPILPANDTLTKITNAENLGEWVDRNEIFRVQTPQAFRLETLYRACEDWRATPPSDEATYLRPKGIPIAAVEGDPMLEKLTTSFDFERAEAWLASRLVPRTGIGFDVHAFAGEGPIMLGGIAVPHDRGLAGHSDADVVLHAITDALLGAAGLGDIGQHFPPSDEKWKDAASEFFLAHAAGLVRDRGGIIDHVDCTLICEAPRIGAHREQIRARIADILGLRHGQVSFKATTTERLGFTGRGEGIAAQAVANIRLEISE
jgi:2-C-methyl-D-erythritol 4-phosphate cytidylyltransferase/2-C-methyl-D-erythritol 2,4-cyclodiphosphate synthase